MEPAGRDPGRAFGAPAVGPVTLRSQEKSSPFRTIFSPAWGMGPWTMPEVECRPRNYLGDQMNVDRTFRDLRAMSLKRHRKGQSATRFSARKSMNVRTR